MNPYEVAVIHLDGELSVVTILAYSQVDAFDRVGSLMEGYLYMYQRPEEEKEAEL